MNRSTVSLGVLHLIGNALVLWLGILLVGHRRIG